MEPLLLVEDKSELRACSAGAGAQRLLRRRSRRWVRGHPKNFALAGYQLVITDLKMPGASGWKVLRESKQADSTIPVILLTLSGPSKKRSPR